jgi:type II secretory pathway pseudopilin PulG
MTQITKLSGVSRRQRQAGLTLAETLLVLAIGALAIVGGTLLYLQATGSNKLNQGINQFVTLQSGIRSLYAGQPNFAGLNTTVVTQANAAPPDMTVTLGTLRNAWGGAVVVAVPAGNDTFTIESTRIPKNSCAKLVSLNPGGGGGSGITTIAVDSDASATFSATGSGSTLIPVVATAAVAACQSATDSITITWTFN